MNNRLRVRPAVMADAKVLETLAKEIWNQNYSPVIGKSQVDYMLEKFQSQDAIEKDMRSGFIYHIATFDDIPCGYSAIRKDDTGIFLSKLYVKRGYRHKGVARAMLYTINAYAKKNKARRIWLACNRHNAGSLETYERFGFIIIDTCSKEISVGVNADEYILEKKLI
jgi:GNAT superfamily N-acetyltransferase